MDRERQGRAGGVSGRVGGNHPAGIAAPGAGWEDGAERVILVNGSGA